MSTDWSPQVGPQADAIAATWCNELFFGGARGGGKSDFLLGDYLQDVPKFGKDWQGILFRRTYSELEELIRRSHELYPRTGAEWLEGKTRWQWKNGARLKFRHMENDRDAEHYRGHQYGWVGFDEIDAFPTDGPYRKMRACNRWAGRDLPTKRMRAAGNPGGVGSGWIKSYFIDPHPKGFVPWQDAETGRTVMFVPSRLTDNAILMEKDPTYINALKGVGSPALVAAWLKGDFNVVVGSFFPEFCDKHIIQPFEIPEHWTRFRAMDWGSAKPFVVLWIAHSPENTKHVLANSLVVYREWYGGNNNVGLKLSSREVAEGIKERELRGERISYSVIDPAAFNSQDGPSTGERLNNFGIYCQPADNKRIVGWQQVRDRLRGYDGRPLLYIFGDACKNLVRTFPTMQHDERNAEDLNTDGDDHSVDALRYGCMSRPYTPMLPESPEPIRGLRDARFEEIGLSLDDIDRGHSSRWESRI